MKIVGSLGAGSGLDLLGRQLARSLETAWKQPVIVENRPGGGGFVGARFVAAQPPDGQTLLLTGPSLIIGKLQKNDIGLDPDRDLVPIAKLANLRIVLATNSNIPVRTLQEFASYSRNNPGKLNYGGSGRGALITNGIEVIKKSFDLNLTPVHYPAGGPAQHVTALLTNEIQFAWGVSAFFKAQLATGKITVLAAVSDRRHPDLPDISSIVEAGHRGLIPQTWNGIFAPANTPSSVTQKIHREVNHILQSADFRANLDRTLGMDPTPQPFGQFAEDNRVEFVFWASLFKELGLEPQ